MAIRLPSIFESQFANDIMGRFADGLFADIPVFQFFSDNEYVSPTAEQLKEEVERIKLAQKLTPKKEEEKNQQSET